MTEAPIRMQKDEMEKGFAKGRTLIQEEWANPQEIKWVDELIAEGKATATPWEYKDEFQCERRRVTGVIKESKDAAASSSHT